MSAMPDWGPSRQTGKGSGLSIKWIAWAVIAVLVYGMTHGGTRHQSATETAAGIVLVVIIALFALPSSVKRWLLAPRRRRREPAPVGDGLGAVRGAAVERGGGVYLGALSRGELRFARAERAVLLLGHGGRARRAR